MLPNGAPTNEASGDSRQIGQCTSSFASFPVQHAPPFFANPFMAPFLPQHGHLPTTADTNSDRSSLSPHSSPSPNDSYLQQMSATQKPDFRQNPLTGGYFLSPNQYQEMLQYMQNFVIQENANQQRKELKNIIDPTLGGLLNSSGIKSANDSTQHVNSTTTTKSNNESNDLLSDFTSIKKDAINNFFPMTSANLDNHEAAEPPGSNSPPLITSGTKEKPDSTNIIESQPSSSSSPVTEQPDTNESNDEAHEGAQETTNEHQKTPTDSPRESRSNSTNNEESTENEVVKNEEINEATEQKVEEDPQQPSTSPKTDKQRSDDSKRPMDPSSVPLQKSTPNTSTEERTSELIRKQMNEIEKEISRRMQNQNIKKIDEKELSQLLNDHGFGDFVNANGSTTDFAIDFSNNLGHGLPYKPPQMDVQQTGKPTLEQLRSSFSPPDEQPMSANSMDSYSFGMTATGNGLGLHGPAAFATNPILQQSISPAVFQNPTAMANGHYTTTIPAQQQANMQFMNAVNAHNPTQPMFLNGMSGPFNYMNIQGQPLNPQMNAPHASYGMQPTFAAMPPTITPELAAALFQQLQQQNPQLLQNLVGQHQFANSIGQTAPVNNQPVSTNNRVNVQNVQRFNNAENAVKCTAVPQSPPAQKPQISGIPAPPSNTINAINRKTANDSAPNSSSTTHRRSVVAENGWPTSSTSTNDQESGCENKENGGEQETPVWVMRDTFLKRMERMQQRENEQGNKQNGHAEGEHNNAESQQLNADDEDEEQTETQKLIQKDHNSSVETEAKMRKGSSGTKKEEYYVHEPAVLIEGVLFPRCRYLGSTQLVSDGRATKSSRMAQAQEAVSRVKAPEGESQPSTEIDLFVSSNKIMVLNTDLQDILIDLLLKSVSYIADIGDLVVLIARRLPQSCENGEEDIETIRRTPKMICHVFESEEASFIVQSIGQAFQVAYVEFLRANGIDDPNLLNEVNYQEVLNSQELMGEELEMFARKETQKDVIVPKKVGEPLGVVVVESGWGSMLPTVVLASLAPGGPASRSNQLNIGDQIIAINGISLVGLPLLAAQQNIKNAKSSTAVRLTVVSTPPVVEVRIKRPDTKYQLGFSVQNGVICSLLRGGIAERGGIRVGHRIIEINNQSVVAVPHEKIVNMLATATGEIYLKTMPTSMFRLLTGQEVPNYI